MSPNPNKISMRLEDFEPEHLLDVVHGAKLEHYILGHTKCSAHLESWSYGGFSVDIGRYNFPVRAVGLFPATKLCIGYMRSRNEKTWVNGFDVSPRTLEFYPAGSELNYRATPDGEWVAIEFEEVQLQSVARSLLGCEIDLPWKRVVSFSLSDEEKGELDRLVRMLWLHPASGVEMIRPILSLIIKFFRQFQHGGSSRTRANWERRKIILQRADSFFRTHFREPFDLSNFTSFVGASPRTLQREFLLAFGLTPSQWARCFALHRARTLLTQPEKRIFTVEAIAFQCGFRHMGRFSKYYQQLFGEQPSVTRRKFLPRN
ncbi:MAG: helix-turn-helix domain-containing protein [Chthoniobacterales bacterium]